MSAPDRPAVLLRGAWVMAPEPVRDGAVAVVGDRIAAVGPYAELAAAYPGADVHGGEHDIVCPGFVNTHGHFSEGLITGIASQHTLVEWLDALIAPVKLHTTPEVARLGTLVAGIQMLRSGITTANDMFVTGTGPEPVTPAVVEALDELRLRGVVSYGAGDADTGDPAAELAEHDALREAAAGSDLCTFRLGMGSMLSHSPALLEQAVAYAVDGGHGVHVHLQEVREEVTRMRVTTGRTSVEHAAHVGLFEAPTLAAHCVWTDRRDRELMAEHRVGVAHNPLANGILASGIAPVAELRQLGVDVGFGVDGAASNDAQDFLQAIKTGALLARVRDLQATAMTAREAFEIATIGGARALRMEDEIGSIEVGKKADLVLLDGSGPTLANVHEPYQAVVFVAGSREVAEVWVDGLPSVLGGDVVTVDPVEVAERSRPVARRLVTEAGLGHLSALAGAV
ncbi:MAG: amidohydrolase [Nocardioides sp.]|nr:amidohydrolase [Nocardioides sp.]